MQSSNVNKQMVGKKGEGTVKKKGKNKETFVCILTIPYTGTCGVVMGKAIGAGAWKKQKK